MNGNKTGPRITIERTYKASVKDLWDLWTTKDDVGTVVEFHSDGQSVRMVLTFDPMHDEEWTRRAVMGHESQLGKLEMVMAGKRL